MRSLPLALLFAAALNAQGPSDPSPLLEIRRVPNGVKPQLPYQAAKAAVDVIGIASLTGLPETWFIEAHPSFASIEDLGAALRAHAPAGPANQFGEAQADEVLGSPRTVIAAFAPEYSNRPGEATRNLAKTRYFRVSIYRMRPGVEQTMSQLESVRKREYESVNLDRPELVYRAVSGAPATTFFVLAPLTSLGQIDEGAQRLPSYLEPMSAWAADSETGREHLLFRVDPNLSYVSPQFAAGDADYWKPQRQ